MSCPTVAKKLLIRRDIRANWARVNPILLNGEMGYESDTGRLKIGDGVTPWNFLQYYVGNGSGANGVLDGGMPNSIYTTEPEIDAGGVV